MVLFITTFPSIFNLASVLSATTALTGVYLVWSVTDERFNFLCSSKWGLSILLGGGLGILLTLFHFFTENRLIKFWRWSQFATTLSFSFSVSWNINHENNRFSCKTWVKS